MKIKENRGITLIALVITIIVLLLLAGVSIASLTGENGMLIKANDAKEESQIEDVKERAKTDILGIQAENENGNITKEQLKTVLEKYFKDVPEALPDDITNLELIAKEEFGGYKIRVIDIWKGAFAEGEMPEPPAFNPETVTLSTEAKNTDKYGWKVGNYTVQTSEMSTNVWRLFFQDSNYTYIITDELIGNYVPKDYFLTNRYLNGTCVSQIGRRLNPKCSSSFGSSSNEWDERAVAWLTDTSDEGMWIDYKNSDAVFAIGTPTLELFQYSYNSTGKTNKITVKYTSWGGYTEAKMSDDGKLKTEDNYGIYNKTASSSWWIASPYHSSNVSLFYLDEANGIIDLKGITNDNSGSLRPIVAIPTDVFKDKYFQSLVNE